MNQLEITRYLNADKSTSKYFRGVFARDELWNLNPVHGLYIVNTDISTGPGKHWVVLFIAKNIEYFDSLGLIPSVMEPFLKALKKPYVYSNQRLQAANSDVCGDYCILYAYFKCRGWNLKEFLNLFTSNLHQNDRLVELENKKWN